MRRLRRSGAGRSAALHAGVPLVSMMLAATVCGVPAARARAVHPVAGSATSAPAAAVASCADTVYSGMTQAQRIGQLFMGGVSASSPSATDLGTLRDQHVGSVMLTGRSSAGVTATRDVVDGIRGQADTVSGRRVGLLVATDQEGGQVQVLSGPGFSTMPNALTQGGWSTSTLRSRAAGWAGELRSAGVDLNLAPVADVVPADLGTRNQPIGRYYREYGHTPDVVASHSKAFAVGSERAGVMTTLKHFPGLGRVIGNTDTTANVVDSVTTTTSSYLTPFRSGIQAGSPFVMVSLATYSKIDSHHIAAFSPTVVRKLLRTQLGFKGVVISDDLGQAVAVRSYTPAQRATGFLAAGGDLILTVKPSIVPAMAQAVGSRMQTDAAFRSGVADSVHRVLAAKAAAGLLDCG
ncbi:glycoside hydrolase family 3 N-terminal domain-containing protein [Streptomyces sp. H51]|uniref:glycoside hydrolase family 3 N-terminal domain-containing protein n=1 Tax=Streptomyces sp. H51 TaxID=3111770 RepID=UPI002D781F03|nr:glycoside hydrolase family 3 N-terminal domain-containing protein [Streptomyces sp. H51]